MPVIINGTTGVTFPNGVTMSDGTSAPVTIAQGGTGANTRQAAMDALAGAVTSGRYLRGDGTDVIMDTLKAADMTGTLAVANGGTGATSLTANNVILGNGTSAVQAVAPGTSGNVLTSNGTTWTSTALPAGGVTSLNGQTGAITDTAYGAIGSYVIAFVGIAVNAGDTLAASNLTRNTFNVRGGLNSFNAASGDVLTNYSGALSSGNTFTSLGLSGTWRAMAFSSNAGGGGAANIFVRIS